LIEDLVADGSFRVSLDEAVNFCTMVGQKVSAYQPSVSFVK